LLDVEPPFFIYKDGEQVTTEKLFNMENLIKLEDNCTITLKSNSTKKSKKKSNSKTLIGFSLDLSFEVLACSYYDKSLL